ncbi:glycosyltransferase [Flavobacterium tibetense]|uniref:Glycosyltransferase family 2 protein n=1 Tax=Flavobacterium tibetense TaxID=2233533 RepID=A0A365P108_9FLAO|nr:glycosyltransferase [Flavobacterium tibetense]RBA28013.1 glycosyltransferase family 2 protein [Flavobacterium tibetense]
MQNFPLVSVICLSYNHEAYVVESLNSVINQTYPNIELLIADDYSTDHSVGIIQKWLENHLNVFFLANEKNLGNTKTFNQLAKKAKGEFIIDLAADDILLPNCIENQIKTFQNSNYKNLGIVYGNLIEIDENGSFFGNYYTEVDHPESGDIYKMVVGRTTKICSVSSMIKKSVLEKLGYYDENLAYEDLDLWIRTSRDYEFEYIPEILAKKRVLSHSLSSHFLIKNNSRSKKLNVSTLQILIKALQLNRTKDEHKALIRRIRFEMYKFIKARNFNLLFQLFLLEIKVRLKSI